MYQQTLNPFTKEIGNQVIRLSDGACIPFDPANTDYQAYLKWVEEGGEIMDSDGNLLTSQQSKALVNTFTIE